MGMLFPGGDFAVGDHSRELWAGFGADDGVCSRSGHQGPGRRVVGFAGLKIKKIKGCLPTLPHHRNRQQERGGEAVVERRGGYSPDALSIGMTLLLGTEAFIS